jgi:hypothetical protein
VGGGAEPEPEPFGDEICQGPVLVDHVADFIYRVGNVFVSVRIPWNRVCWIGQCSQCSEKAIVISEAKRGKAWLHTSEVRDSCSSVLATTIAKGRERSRICRGFSKAVPHIECIS